MTITYTEACTLHLEGGTLTAWHVEWKDDCDACLISLVAEAVNLPHEPIECDELGGVLELPARLAALVEARRRLEPDSPLLVRIERELGWKSVPFVSVR